VRALVTGGAGFIGSHLVDRLLSSGARVRVLDNLLAQAHPSGRAEHLSRDAELVVGDVRDRAKVDAALEGIDTVFHLGGIVGNGQSMVQLREYADAVFALLPRRPSISIERARLLTRELRARRHLDAAELGAASPDEKILRTLAEFFKSESQGLDIEIVPSDALDDPKIDPNWTWAYRTTKPLVLKVDGEPSRIVVPMRAPGLETCKGIIVITEHVDCLRVLKEDMVRPLCSLGDTFGGLLERGK